jgi:acyl-CoA thioester hydrolase
MEMESAIKFAFIQDIYRSADNKLIVKGKITGTALNARGRPEIPEEMKQIMSNVAINKTV